MDFCRRTVARSDYPRFLDKKSEKDAYIGGEYHLIIILTVFNKYTVLQHRENQTLEHMYGHNKTCQSLQYPRTSSTLIQGFFNTLEQRRNQCASNAQASAFEEVEQERQVEVQVEEVREVQKPNHFEALSFPGLHPSILAFAETGILPSSVPGTEGFEHIFTMIGRTFVGQKFNITNGSSRLLATTEFLRTIKTKKEDRTSDNFLVSQTLQSRMIFTKYIFSVPFLGCFIVQKTPSVC